MKMKHDKDTPFSQPDDEALVDLFAAGAFDEKLSSGDLTECKEQLRWARDQIALGLPNEADKMLKNLVRMLRAAGVR